MVTKLLANKPLTQLHVVMSYADLVTSAGIHDALEATMLIIQRQKESNYSRMSVNCVSASLAFRKYPLPLSVVKPAKYIAVAKEMSLFYPFFLFFKDPAFS